MLNITQPMLNYNDKYGFITGFMFSPCCNSDTRHSGVGQVVMKNCFLRFYSDDKSVDIKIKVPDYSTWSEPRQYEFDIWQRYLMNWWMRPVVYNNIDIGPFKLEKYPYDATKKCLKINLEFDYDQDGFWETAQNAYIRLHLGDYYKNQNMTETYKSTCYSLGYYTGRKGYGRSWKLITTLYVLEEEMLLLNSEKKNFDYWLKSNYMIVDGKKYLYRV